ncbi:transposase, partial [Kocuria sediminis]|uniref:transposase n=1 Tax=Kocuria sediminis TaxID=1038857 RepID=UPI00197F8C85
GRPRRWVTSDLACPQGGLEGCCCARGLSQEFRDHVVRVPRAREDGVAMAQIAKDLGIEEMTLSKWMRQADVEDGEKPGVTKADSTQNRELKKQIRLLEQEGRVLRRPAAYLSQAILAGKDATGSRASSPPTGFPLR